MDYTDLVKGLPVRVIPGTMDEADPYLRKQAEASTIFHVVEMLPQGGVCIETTSSIWDVLPEQLELAIDGDIAAYVSRLLSRILSNADAASKESTYENRALRWGEVAQRELIITREQFIAAATTQPRWGK